MSEMMPHLGLRDESPRSRVRLRLWHIGLAAATIFGNRSRIFHERRVEKRLGITKLSGIGTASSGGIQEVFGMSSGAGLFWKCAVIES